MTSATSPMWGNRALRVVATNFAKVFGGQAVAMVLGFGALTLNSHALGAKDFGVLIVIQAVSEFALMMFAFQTWQAIVRFGAGDLERGDFRRLQARFGLGLAMDVCAALAASLAAASAFLFLSKLVGISPDHRMLGVAFALFGIAQATSTSIGILRLTGRFGLVTIVQVTGAAALLANAFILSRAREPLASYVYSIGLISAATSIALIAAAALRLAGLTRDTVRLTTPASLDRWAFFRFALATSASGSLNALRQRGEVLIISGLLGPGAAGFYAVAYRAAALLARFGEAGRQAAYPEIAGLVASGDLPAARTLVLRLSAAGTAISIPIFLCAVVFGRPALQIVFGTEFGQAHSALLWLMTSTLLYGCTFAVGSFIQITRGASYFLALNLIATTGFLAGAFAGPRFWGLQGAGLGATIFAVIFAALLSIIFRAPRNEMMISTSK
ncbi:MAG: lipopolysaccharide biosynthesis protein [Hyphomonadaceae bacterium]|nr:lipopolysaccharide biosynthesis protein [Hyphomonadaceae bacterium]